MGLSGTDRVRDSERVGAVFLRGAPSLGRELRNLGKRRFVAGGPGAPLCGLRLFGVAITGFAARQGTMQFLGMNGGRRCRT